MTKHFRYIELVVDNSTKVDDHRVAAIVSSETFPQGKSEPHKAHGLTR